MAAVFVNKLPLVALDEGINKCKLFPRFVDPFLSGLFDDSDQGTYLRWMNESTLEAKQLSNNMRPDFSITQTLGIQWTSNGKDI